jgi:hypothetical protein
MGDLDHYDEETLYLAFWLQDKIYREGIEGIHYMRKARTWAKRNAADITADEISKELNNL